MSEEMTISQWRVPVDDVSCYWYAIFTSFGAPVDQATMRAQRLELYELPDYRPRLGRANSYGFDLQQQKTQTYTGMGHDINVHDPWAVESQGAIQDRTREHLGQSDKAIVAYRRLLLGAIEDVAQRRRPMMTPGREADPRTSGDRRDVRGWDDARILAPARPRAARRSQLGATRRGLLSRLGQPALTAPAHLPISQRTRRDRVRPIAEKEQPCLSASSRERAPSRSPPPSSPPASSASTRVSRSPSPPA